MKNISRKIVICFIACLVFVSLSSCDKVAKKAYKEVAEEFIEEGAEKGGKKSSKKVLKQVNGRPLPDNSTALTDVGRKNFKEKQDYLRMLVNTSERKNKQLFLKN